jgi:RNA polymerase sigma-70 factor, ECF subfamily
MEPEQAESKFGVDGETGTEAQLEVLLLRASRGDDRARDELLSRHRSRLWRMVAIRLDRRVAARVDASDIVQEALTEAACRLPDYLSHRPLPFYPWLRHIAWQHLQKCHQRHINAQRRSVVREGMDEPTLPDESATQLVDCLVSDDTSVSGRLIRAEERHRLRAALALLPARDREALVLRHLEQLSTAEIAVVLGISAGAVMTRHTRALERLRRLLELGCEEKPK